jgi:hypothetical protein
MSEGIVQTHSSPIFSPSCHHLCVIFGVVISISQSGVDPLGHLWNHQKN